MKQLYFMRHGQSEANAANVYGGAQPHIQLTSLGRQQAHLAGQDLIGKGIDLIVSSPLDRAVETARIVAVETGYPVAAVQTDERLHEIGVGKLTGQPDEGFVKGFAYLAAGTDPTAETPAQITSRVTAALKDLERSGADKTVLIVAHAGIGRTLRAILTGVTLADLAAITIPNAQSYELPLDHLKEAIA